MNVKGMDDTRKLLLPHADVLCDLAVMQELWGPGRFGLSPPLVTLAHGFLQSGLWCMFLCCLCGLGSLVQKMDSEPSPGARPCELVAQKWLPDVVEASP